MIKLLYTRARREGYSTAISHLLYERECTCSSYPCWSCWVSEYLLLLKRRVVFRQTTCCFSSNDVLFFIKRRVVFRQTMCCFSSNDVSFFVKRRVVFHQTTSGDVHRSATLKMLSLCPKLFCATEKSPSNFLHQPRLDVAVYMLSSGRARLREATRFV